MPAEEIVDTNLLKRVDLIVGDPVTAHLIGAEPLNIKDRTAPLLPFSVDTVATDAGPKMVVVTVDSGPSPPYGVDPAKPVVYVRRAATAFEEEASDCVSIGACSGLGLTLNHLGPPESAKGESSQSAELSDQDVCRAREGN
jgi:hypothetical protein